MGDLEDILATDHTDLHWL